MKIIITKLDCPEYYGDWHDKSLRWLVNSKGVEEIQKFSTKKDAILWAKLLRKHGKFETINEVFTKFMQGCGLYA